MKGALDKSGSESRHDGDIIPSSAGADDTQSPTVSFVPQAREAEEPSAVVDEHDKTIISQRPVAAPEEFYKSLPLAELAAMLEGKRLDHFTVEQMIGGGGMGAVFRGRDERLDRTVAIKVIPASKRDPETLRRFRLEAQAAARLDHPNIARVYYVGEAEQWNYIVFEFIDGINIRDLVGMEGPLSVDDAVYYTRQVAEALQHAHEREVVHRDIKPSNLLVTAGGIAKVVDMGLARHTALDKSTADATASGVTLGTFDYISPEQARNPRDADVRSDLYSLGCTLFFMLTSHPPFPEGTALQKLLNHGSVPPPDPRGWRDDLSDQLYAIMMKLMAKQPSDRYQKPAELINDLMLLAEIEDLPRSQSPGTVMFTPSVAQRSLLEANLPWLVAFAFLLGSTLWLQSVQAISNSFILPELRFETKPASRPSDLEKLDANDGGVKPKESELPRTPLDAIGGLPATERLPVEAGTLGGIDNTVQGASESPVVKPATGPWVVSSSRPADVEAERWVSSIYRAVQQVQQAGVGGDIELRGNILIDRPLVLADVSISLRSAGASRARIEVAADLLNDLADWSGAIEVGNSKLRLANIDIVADVGTPGSSRKVGVFFQTGDSEIEARGCSVTLTGVPVLPSVGASPSPVFAVLGDEQRLASSVKIRESKILLTFEDSIVRGNGSFLGLRVGPYASRRFEVSLNNSLFAVEGSIIDVAHSIDLDSRIARNIRLFCEHSTFVTRYPFAVLDYSGPTEPLLSLNRTSNKCVFATSPEHVVLKGLSQESFYGSFKWLLLKGIDNAYDERVSALCVCYDQDDEEIFTFGINEGSQDGWFAERGNEQQVRWARKTKEMPTLSESKPSDFEIEEGMFFPGVMLGDKFPPL